MCIINRPFIYWKEERKEKGAEIDGRAQKQPQMIIRVLSSMIINFVYENMNR